MLSSRDKFEKALIHYQGKQIESLFNDLDTHFIARGKPTSAEIKALPLNKHGRKDGTDLRILYKALLDTGYSALFEDVNVVAHRYWGWKLLDVSYLSLGPQFRLFKHLEL